MKIVVTYLIAIVSITEAGFFKGIPKSEAVIGPSFNRGYGPPLSIHNEGKIFNIHDKFNRGAYIGPGINNIIVPNHGYHHHRPHQIVRVIHINAPSHLGPLGPAGPLIAVGPVNHYGHHGHIIKIVHEDGGILSPPYDVDSKIPLLSEPIKTIKVIHSGVLEENHSYLPEVSW